MRIQLSHCHCERHLGTMKYLNSVVILSIILTKIIFLNASSDLSEYEVSKITKLLYSVKSLAKLNSNATTSSLERDVRRFNSGCKNEDIKLSITELIEKYGYKTEIHEVTTEDGYILTAQRIPNEGPVVFLMHGLFGSAVDWILTGTESLALYLASEGFDVWMGNARGNKYSRKHTTLEPDCNEFWDFSFDEIGRYDLAANIDYVLKLTGEVKLTIIAHSLGSAAAFVLLSELPEYNDKLSGLIVLSPTAWITHANSPVFKILSQSESIDNALLKAIGKYEVKPNDMAVKAIAKELCGDNQFSKTICENYALLTTGLNRQNIDFANMPLIFRHFPAGTATKVLKHYAQVLYYDQFRRYDYGEGNLDRYDLVLPPDYPVENIKTPVALFCSDSDWLYSVKDVMVLKDKLKNVVDFNIVENYSNIDFVWGKSAKELVYLRVLELIQKHSHD